MSAEYQYQAPMVYPPLGKNAVPTIYSIAQPTAEGRLFPLFYIIDFRIQCDHFVIILSFLMSFVLCPFQMPTSTAMTSSQRLKSRILSLNIGIFLAYTI